MIWDQTKSTIIWHFRLQSMCAVYLGEVGEEELYEEYEENKDLEDFLCFGRGALGACSTSGKLKQNREDL